MLIGHSQNNNEELSDEGKSLSAISDLPKNSSLEKQASNQSFADLTNILLKGIVGDLWMIFRTRKVLISRLNYIWYVPLLLLILLVILSPTIISLFFTYQLFLTQNIALGTVYVIMFFPISFLSLMLFGMVGLLGDTESL